MKTINNLYIAFSISLCCIFNNYLGYRKEKPILYSAIVNKQIQSFAFIKNTDTSKINKNIKSTKQAYELTLGTFKEIQFGDYVHFEMIDKNKKNQSFYFWKESKMNKKKFSEFEDGKHKGKKIKVYWIEKKVYIPEAGGYEKIEIIIDAELLK